MPVMVEVYPDRLRRRSREREEDSRWTPEQRIRWLVGKGLRAQLRTGNLLTGQVYVALDFFPHATAAKVDVDKNPLELPTVPNSLDDLQAQVLELVTKINQVPFEQIGKDARTVLASMDKTLKSVEQLTRGLNNDVSPEIAAAMKDVRKTLDTAERTIASDSPLQQDMRQTLQELTRAAASLRVLTDYLERHPESLLRGKPEDTKK
ncbi:MAG: mammalian cell entry protein, partial [Cupriavidus sp.]|nr:mammalian cell entry protein [Cupriavidus sp.]